MRTAAPPLLPILRSRLQGEILASTLLVPERRQSLTELAASIEADLASVHREVTRLEAAGILRSERIGNVRLVSADTSSPLYPALSELTLRTFGPALVAGEEFAGMPGVEDLFLFGSWAARYEGVKGPPPADIDVLVIGEPERALAYEAATRAERRLGRRVNVTIRSRQTWDAARDGFVRNVRSSPMVRLPIDASP